VKNFRKAHKLIDEKTDRKEIKTIIDMISELDLTSQSISTAVTHINSQVMQLPS